jgi:hypothetical protein
MAGIFNLDLSSVGGAVQGVSKGISDLANGIRTAITGVDAQKQAELLSKLTEIDAAAQMAQAEIDKTEAASSKLFVAGWRPFLGWVCGSVFAYNYILRPLAGAILVWCKAGVDLPMLNLAEISPVLMGLLGLGAIRTVEKISSASGNH